MIVKRCKWRRRVRYVKACAFLFQPDIHRDTSFTHQVIALQCGFTGDRQGGNALPPTLWQRNRRGPQDYCAGVGVVQRTVSIQS